MPEFFFLLNKSCCLSFSHELGIISWKASDNPFGSTDKTSMYSILLEWHGNFLGRINYVRAFGVFFFFPGSFPFSSSQKSPSSSGVPQGWCLQQRQSFEISCFNHTCGHVLTALAAELERCWDPQSLTPRVWLSCRCLLSEPFLKFRAFLSGW